MNDISINQHIINYYMSVYFFFLTDKFMQKTEWHKICIFKPGLRDSVYDYLKKGQRVLVNGKLNYSEFKDEEGNTHPSTTIIADEVILFQ